MQLGLDNPALGVPAQKIKFLCNEQTAEGGNWGIWRRLQGTSEETTKNQKGEAKLQRVKNVLN
jgi:hypothetical protein